MIRDKKSSIFCKKTLHFVVLSKLFINFLVNALVDMLIC